MSEDKKPREFWITFKPYVKDPLGPCINVLKYVANFSHEHGLHVIEYTAYQDLKQKLALVVKALEKYEACQDFNEEYSARDTLSKIKGDGNEYSTKNI